MRAVRAADEEALIAESLPRLDALIAEGVTTIEIKSGYGLSLDAEFKMLRAAKALGGRRPVRIATTFLGAHAVPPDTEAEAYVGAVCDTMIPAIAGAGLADAVDAFCESVGFTPAQTERVLKAAAAHGLSVKVHAAHLSHTRAETRRVGRRGV